jgi:tetratricopeptide (TPR) repeat protein
MLRLSCNRPGVGRLAVAVLFINLFLCPPARGWEKGAADAIAAAALSSLPGEIGAFLEREKPSFISGWEENEGTLARYAGFSTYDSSGHAAAKLASQIALLRELFPNEKTPYMAYRMGILARLAADLSSPFATAVSPEELELRTRFMKDVETDRASLKAPTRPPRLLDNPSAAVTTIVKRASGWAGPVRSQYVSGRGYNVIAQQAAKTFYKTAVQMVRDALFTVGAAGGGAVEAAVRYNYYWDACHYYLKQGIAKNALAAYKKVAETAPSLQLERSISLQDAVEKYTLILNVSSLEEELRQAGAPPEEGVAEQLKAAFLPGAERFAKQSLDDRREEDSRIALTLCLREGRHSRAILQICRSLYGVEGLKDLDVPENAQRIYKEAGAFETAAEKAGDGGRIWVANDSLIHATALYSAVPSTVPDLHRESKERIEQIGQKMRSLPLSALLSENLFHAAVDSLVAGEGEAAMRDLQLIHAWKPGDTDVRSAIGDADAIRLFNQGKKLVKRGDYARAAEQFRQLAQRYPRSPLAGPSKKILALYARMQAENRGRLLTLLRSAYEASFVDDEDTVYQLCDEILGSHPEDDVRDRAKLLIAVAWYKSNGKGYRGIDKIFRDLLKRRVIEQEGDDLVLKKRLDFYFGLADPFPTMELSDFPESVLEKLGPKGANVISPEERADSNVELAGMRDDAQRSIDDVDEKIGQALDRQRSDLDDARDLHNEAKNLFEEGDYEGAKEKADEAIEELEKLMEPFE